MSHVVSLSIKNLMRSSQVKRSAFIKKEKLLSVCVCLILLGPSETQLLKPKYDSGREITKHWK